MRVPSLTSTLATAAPPRTGVGVVAAILLAVGLAAALSVDVVKTGQGVKSDESTYVAMALSVAYDGDLVYERRDLDRFFGLYRWGPDGIFLKRGKQLRVRIDASDVACPRITSTSVISGTGFMKCMPSTLSGRFVAAPSDVIEIDEVLDARIASRVAMASRLVNSARFASAFSTIASTM